MEGLKRGSAAIVGVAESDLGQVADGLSVIDLMAQGIERALDDCGLSLKDVDGLFSATTQSRLSVLALAEYLGIDPPFLGSTIVGGSSFEYHVAHAMGAIALGLCNVAVIAYGSTQRSVGRKQASVREINPYETPFKPFLPSSAYALAASRHMHQFGTTREQLAAVAVAAREWALLNPAAWEKKPLTIDGVLSSRMVSYPFTVRDCCLVTDGGGAIVVTSAERAQVAEEAAGLCARLRPVDHPRQHLQHAGPDGDRRAGRRQGRLRDGQARRRRTSTRSSSTTPSRSTRSCSWRTSASARRARAARSSAAGASRPRAALPVNTNGGGLSYCHPGMYGLFLLIEAVRQLRGECGARQVKDCEVALAHGNGGVSVVAGHRHSRHAGDAVGALTLRRHPETRRSFGRRARAFAPARSGPVSSTT